MNDTLTEEFRNRFQKIPEYVYFCPGRVNLIGEHIDYCDGFVLPLALERYIVIAAAPNGGTDAHKFWHGHGLPVSVGNAGSHQHLSPASGYSTGNEVWATDTNQGGGIGFHTHAGIWSTASGDHGHAVNSQSVAGAGGAQENRPYYFTLAYIMKL